MNPFSMFKIVNYHIIKFPCNLMYTSKNYHKMIKYWSRMTTSNKRRFLSFDLIPLISIQVKFPYIIKFIVFIIFSSKHYHRISKNYCWMTCSSRYQFIIKRLYPFPFIFFKMKSINIICSWSINKTSEDYHWAFI